MPAERRKVSRKDDFLFFFSFPLLFLFFFFSFFLFACIVLQNMLTCIYFQEIYIYVCLYVCAWIHPCMFVFIYNLNVYTCLFSAKVFRAQLPRENKFYPFEAPSTRIHLPPTPSPPLPYHQRKATSWPKWSVVCYTLYPVLSRFFI